MTVVLIISALLCFVGCKIKTEGKYFDDYISLDKTNAIKGIFLICVFFRHFAQYVKLSGPYNTFFIAFNLGLKQLLVTLFLFYSGFGIMESISKKGKDYVKSIPVKRAPKVLLHFDMAVILYIIFRIVTRGKISIQKALLSLVCWESVGNSNWYILAIVSLYLLTYFSFRFLKNKYVSAVIVTVLSVFYIMLLMRFKPSYWYNTVLCYPLGIWYSLFRKNFEKVVMKNDIIYFLFLTTFLSLFLLLYNKLGVSIWIYEACCLMFVMCVVLVTMKIQFDNELLRFFGKHLFSLYILQRLPMIFFKKILNCNSHPYIFFVMSLICTVLIALIFDFLIKKFDNFYDNKFLALFKKKSNRDREKIKKAV